jgi:hypothetical protein
VVSVTRSGCHWHIRNPPEQAPGRGAERDLGIGNGEPARGLPGLDVPQRPLLLAFQLA